MTYREREASSHGKVYALHGRRLIGLVNGLCFLVFLFCSQQNLNASSSSPRGLSALLLSRHCGLAESDCMRTNLVGREGNIGHQVYEFACVEEIPRSLGNCSIGVMIALPWQQQEQKAWQVSWERHLLRNKQKRTAREKRARGRSKDITETTDTTAAFEARRTLHMGQQPLILLESTNDARRNKIYNSTNKHVSSLSLSLGLACEQPARLTLAFWFSLNAS
jgi:hypothetical protein